MLAATLTSLQMNFSHSNTTLQNCLDKVYSWLNERKLNLNPSKCQVLNIHK